MSGDFASYPHIERDAWLTACQQDDVFELLYRAVRAGSAIQVLDDVEAEGRAFIDLAAAVNPDEAGALEDRHQNRLDLTWVVFGDPDRPRADAEASLVSGVMARADREYIFYQRAQIFCAEEGITLDEFQATYGPLRVFQTFHGDPDHPDLRPGVMEEALAEGRYERVPDDFWGIDIEGES